MQVHWRLQKLRYHWRSSTCRCNSHCKPQWLQSYDAMTLRQALSKHALAPLDVASVKDVEASIAGLRSDKLKQEMADKNARKRAPLESIS